MPTPHQCYQERMWWGAGAQASRSRRDADISGEVSCTRCGRVHPVVTRPEAACMAWQPQSMLPETTKSDDIVDSVRLWPQHCNYRLYVHLLCER